jgi:hypothetical protein
MIQQLTPVYGCPVVLMGERNGRTFGRQDIVRFLQNVHPNQLPWKEGYIDFPSTPSVGGGANSNTCVWEGASGQQYTYQYDDLNSVSPPQKDGNYIFAYFDGDDWVPLYIGQGFLPDRLGPSHHQWRCIISRGATHAHWHVNANKANRLDEEDDLLAAFPGAYEPTGCNDRSGG